MFGKAVPITLTLLAGQSFREFVSSNSIYQSLMLRRYEEARIPTQNQQLLVDYPDSQHWTFLCTEDSPDTVAVLPLLQRLAETNRRFDLTIFREEDDLKPLDALVDDLDLTGDLSEVDTPLLFIFDEEFQLLGQWGPRPQAAEAYLDEWLDLHVEYEALADSEELDDQIEFATLLDALTLEMRVWYNSHLGDECVSEICQLLETVQSTDLDDENQ
ncbi:thioredoxin family protein [Chloroflexi bacterium TSY]|nr:thioredoxin family protein [Chloroflexi bacterium TSY]